MLTFYIIISFVSTSTVTCSFGNELHMFTQINIELELLFKIKKLKKKTIKNFEWFIIPTEMEKEWQQWLLSKLAKAEKSIGLHKKRVYDFPKIIIISWYLKHLGMVMEKVWSGQVSKFKLYSSVNVQFSFLSLRSFMSS